MGVLDDLIVLVKDTIAEANQRGRPDGDVPPQRSEEDLTALRRSLARRAAEARHDEEERERAAAEREQHERQHQERQRQRHQAEAAAARAAQAAGTAFDPTRIARLVRHPHALREMIVLREVLDRPLALRRR